VKDGDEAERERKKLGGKNIRLAIVLGLFALGVYLYFILRFAANR
jgi:hypothetical protein